MAKQNYTPERRIIAFWSKVNKRGSIPLHCPELGHCWEWIGATSKSGYGTFFAQGRRKPRTFTHRYSWELANGQVPERLFVLHKCDNRCCVNPSHLFLGTNQDNVDDMIAKNRNKRIYITGDHTRLTEADVIAMEQICKMWRKAQNKTSSK